MSMKDKLKKLPVVNRFVGYDWSELPGYIRIYHSQPTEEEIEDR